MGALLKVVVGIVLIAVVGFGVLGFLASIGSTKQCPGVQSTAMTSKQIGDTLDQAGAVKITDGDATTVGKSFLGDRVPDLRVCFDAAAGHASGTVLVGPAKIPFYLTAKGADLKGSSPKINELDLDIEAGSVPSAVTGVIKSFMLQLVNGSLSTISLTKKYSYQFADGSVTVRGN